MSVPAASARYLVSWSVGGRRTVERRLELKFQLQGPSELLHTAHLSARAAAPEIVPCLRRLDTCDRPLADLCAYALIPKNDFDRFRDCYISRIELNEILRRKYPTKKAVEDWGFEPAISKLSVGEDFYDRRAIADFL